MTRDQRLMNEPSWKVRGISDVGPNGGVASRIIYDLVCARCSAVEHVSSITKLPPVVVLRKFRQKQWEVDELNPKHCFCPTCITTRKAAKTLNPVLNADVAAALTGHINGRSDIPIGHVQYASDAEKRRHAEALFRQAAVATEPAKEEAVEAEILPAATTEQPESQETKEEPVSTLSPRVMRQIFLSLEDNFRLDGTVGRYIHDYSDERIAKELDVAVADVARIREDAYGPIRDPRVTKAMGLLETLTDEYREIGKMLSALGERVKSFA